MRKANRPCTVITTGVVCRDFIGRRSELELLIDQVVRPPHPRPGSTVLVQGDAGIGKSRLMREFAAALTSRGITPVLSSCYEFGEAPYAPLLEIADGLGATVAVNALGSPVAANDAASGRERTRRFAAFAAALGATAQSKTVVAVVENLQWADIATLELFRHLVDALADRRFVLVATLRSEDIGTVGRATTSLRAEIERVAHRVVKLEPLSAAEMRVLLTSALRDAGRRASPLALEKIVELSDGRPFHAEELLRGMLDDRRDTTDSAPAAIPRSLGAAVHERLGALDEGDREVLAFAAVIGRRFRAAFLAELAGKALTDVLHTLRRARNLQLIVEDPPADEFFFRHQLTREVVYEEILFAEARALHRRIVETFERDAAADATSIAYHAWRSGDRALAVRWNETAGDAAAAIAAHTNAMRLFERAFNAAIAPADRARIAQKLGRAMYAEGELDGAVGWFAASTTAADAAGDSVLARRAALDRALALWEHGRIDEGIAAAQNVTAALADEDSALRFQAETLTASLLDATFRVEEAMAHLDAASRLRSEPESAWAVRHRGIRAHALARLGRIEESEAEFAAAVAASRAMGDREQAVRALNNWGDVRLRAGDLAGAALHYGDGLEAARDLRSPRLIAWLTANNAYVALLRGDLAAARALLLESVEIEHDIETIWIGAQAVLCRLATLTADDVLLRRARIDEALTRAVALGDHNVTAMAGGAALARRVFEGDDAAALANRLLPHVARAADVAWFADAVARGLPSLFGPARELLARGAAETHARSLQAYLQLFDARVALRERRRADADAHAHDAALAFKALGWPIEEAYARELRGGSSIKDALDIFRRCGAHAEVARLTTVDHKQPRRRGEMTLTSREREIVSLVVTGKSNREVARQLVISERTVETHVASVFAKFGVNSRRALTDLLDNDDK